MAHCSRMSNLNRCAGGPSWLMTPRSFDRRRKSCSQQATTLTTFGRRRHHSDSMTEATNRSEKCWQLVQMVPLALARRSLSAPPTCPSYLQLGPVAQPGAIAQRTWLLELKTAAASVAPSQKLSDQSPRFVTEAPLRQIVHFYRSQAWKRAPHLPSEASPRSPESSA